MPFPSGVLLFRANASQLIGTGHVMRCLALAQAWHDRGGQAVFFLGGEPLPVADRLRNEGFIVEFFTGKPGSPADATATAAYAQTVGSSWIILDGYDFSDPYEQTLKQAGHKLFSIDDYCHSSHAVADIVLNQNSYASQSMYSHCSTATKLLLGSRFVLLRREFRSRRQYQKIIPSVATKILVTLGGTDPNSLLSRVLEAFYSLTIPGLEVILVAGPANPRFQELTLKAQGIPGVRVEPSIPDMAKLMAWADLAIIAGGTTAWEIAFSRVPSIVMVLAENQRRVASGLSALGASWQIERPAEMEAVQLTALVNNLAYDQEIRSRMSTASGKLVDGFGCDRVIAFLQGKQIWLRPFGNEDCQLFWEWANDPIVRAAAFNSTPIPWETHQQWFFAKQNDPGCTIFVAINDMDQPVGQIRFDRISSDEFEVGTSIAAAFRGMGLSSVMIRDAADALFAKSTAKIIHAHIKEWNTASRKAFQKAGFIENGMIRVRENPAIHYVLERNKGN